jgi:hypothetical protein
MILIGRRVLTLDDPPGATVTIGPWEFAEFQQWARLDAADPLEMLTMWNLFAAKIEAHPFDVDDVRDLDGVAILAIVTAWTKAIKASPPLRGRRH